MNSITFLNKIKLEIENIEINKIEQSLKLFKIIKKKKSKVIIVGNGGNSTSCTHVSNDLTNYSKIRSVNFNDPNLITCFANDYGYENWVTKALDYYCERNDLVILLSASGNSQNIVNAAKYCDRKKINLITLSGINEKNKLRKLGKINFFVKSKNYNVVELIQLNTLLTIVENLKK
jgi:D-sedoheptulose 7-phosphate isomerase